ncbi:hypothetical protein ACLB6G_14335 [Zhengella sp. ZM62]|uniref:hypothetical protein n=1 Tax=Zhengella sedimenti TaxID=3390035 RepID=UPI0039768D7D
MNHMLAFAAFAVLAGFLGILAFEAFSPDLMLVIALTIALAGYDFFTTIRNRTH